MNTIKFSHPYKKLQTPNGEIYKQAVLIETLLVDNDYLSLWMRKYDTDNGKYKLQGGLHILLIFEKSEGNIFTTIRRHTPEKLKYYHAQRGQLFNIELS